MRSLYESILDKRNKTKTYSSEWLLNDEGKVDYDKFINFIMPYKWDKQRKYKDPDKFVYVTTLVGTIHIDLYVPLGNFKYNKITFVLVGEEYDLVMKLYSNNRAAAKRFGISSISAPEQTKHAMYEVPIAVIKGLLRVSCDFISSQLNTGHWTDRMYPNSENALSKAQKYLKELG